MSAKGGPARERQGFEDIRSTSSGTQSRPEWFSEARPTAAEAARQRQAERRAQRAGLAQRADPHAKKKKAKPSKPSTTSTRASGRPASGQRQRPGSSQRQRPNERSRPAERSRSAERGRERPRKKPMSLLKRRVLIVLTLAAMLLGTGFLVESLLLRVTTVRVSGDQIYEEADILRICGFKTGDNLLLIPAADREKKLERELPYIAKAKITRQIPGTVNIEITAAVPLCSMQGDGVWYVVDAGGKVLETGAGPKEGLLQVIGVSPKAVSPGDIMELQNEERSTVFLELMDAMGSLSEEGQNPAGEFTRMDLSDLMNLRLWYQDRVECRFGGEVQLEYKLRWAWGNLTDERGIKPEESGVLDLSYLPTKKSSYFTPGEGSPTPAPGGTTPETGAEPTPAPDGTVPEDGAVPENGAETTPEPGRGEGIPDTPFTG